MQASRRALFLAAVGAIGFGTAEAVQADYEPWPVESFVFLASSGASMSVDATVFSATQIFALVRTAAPKGGVITVRNAGALNPRQAIAIASLNVTFEF